MQLVKYSAEWCIPCSQLSKILDSVNLNGFEFSEVDIDENPEAASEAKVRGIPTMILQDEDGNELSRKVGVLNAVQIQQWLDDAQQ